MQYLFFFFILCSSCQSGSGAGETPAAVSTATITAMSTDTSSTAAPVTFGGALFLHMSGHDVILSYTDDEGIIHYLPQIGCQLTNRACVWKIRTTGWKPEVYFETAFRHTILLSVIFRPDDDKLENADVRLYADGYRLGTVLTWQPPHNSMNTKIAIETDTKTMRKRNH